MKVEHIGWWPFCYAHDLAIVPTDSSVWPYGYANPTDAMWWFWRVREMDFFMSTSTESHTITVPVRKWEAGAGAQLTDELDLVCCHEGIIFDLPATPFGAASPQSEMTGFVRVCGSDTVGDDLVKFNPSTGLYLPRLTVFLQITSFTPSYTSRWSNDFPPGEPDTVVATLGAESITLPGSGITDGFGPVSVSFSPSAYWSHGGMWDEPLE